MTKAELAERRHQLSAQIGQLRTELGQAYHGLAKPLHYAEVGVKGLQVVRQNAWAIALLPSVVGLAYSFFGWTKKSEVEKLTRQLRQEQEINAERKGVKPLGKWLGRAYAAFKFYRRVRPFLPL